MKGFLKKYGVYLVAAVLFVAASFIYCLPSLQGKVLLAGDDVNGRSAVQESIRYHEQTGDWTFWTDAMFSGMPNYQIGGFHYQSDSLLSPLKTFFHRGPQHPAWILIFYLLSFFILLRSFGVDARLSIAGAFAIALSSYFIVIIAAGHGGKTIAISYITLVAAGFYLIFRKKYGLGAIFTMIFSAIGFSIHPQMAYYLFMMIGLFYIAELWIHISRKQWKELAVGTAVFALALAIGLGTGSSTIFANSEYAEQTMRGGHSDLVAASDEDSGKRGLDIDYATGWSYGIDESMSFIIPGFKGGSSTYPVGTGSNCYKALLSHGVGAKSAKDFCESVPMYWGEQPFTAGNVYMGAIVCFLFVLGLMLVKGPYKWALLAATLFSVALSWGHNFMWLTELFFNHFPMYNKFRAVSSILIVAEITMPLLGFLAVKQLMDGTIEKPKAIRSIFTAAGITAGICLMFALFGGSICSFTSASDAQFSSQIPDWLYSAIISDRAALLKSDSWRSFFFIAAAAIVLWIFAKGKLKPTLMVVILGLLVVIDMWPVDRRYFNDDSFIAARNEKDAFSMQPYEQILMQDPDPHFRIMNLTVNTFNDARSSYYLKSIGGYSAAKLRRYQDLIDVYLSKVDLPVVGMLNGKYLITQDESGMAMPQQNPYALGNAWFVDDIIVADDAIGEIEMLGQIDLSNTAVTDRSFEQFVVGDNLGHDDEASVTLRKYTPRYIDYVSQSSKPGTIVFSEIYYPYGWKATIDGRSAEHFRANYTLRALNVPAGRHEIHFEFDPDSVRKGNLLSMICVITMYALTLLIAAAAIIRKTRRSNG